MDTTTTTPQDQTTQRRLERPNEGRVLGGVAAGIARHTGSSVAMVRLGFLVAALFAGFGIILYAAAWALLPEEGDPATAAERWLQNLTTPGKRAGAFLIGLAVLIVLAGMAPISILAAVVLLAGAAVLAGDRSNRPIPTDGTQSAIASDEETEQ